MNQENIKLLPLISVIVPVYNIMDCLERCVRSICNQSYQNLEIILVDDGSTDGTSILCDHLMEQDSRIRVFHKENGGSSSARNKGIQESRGTYLGFVDSDDYIMEDMYETLYQRIQESGLQVSQIARKEIAETGEELPAVCFQEDTDYSYTSSDFLRELLLHRGDCSFCTKLVHRDLFLEEQFPIGVLNEDFHLLVHMLAKLKGVATSPKKLYCVYYRSNSNTRKLCKNEFSRVYADCVNNADMVASMVERNYKELIPVAFRFGMFQRLEYLLHIPITMMTKENQMYQDIVTYIRKYIWKIMTNSVLTPKNKCYLLLFAISPRMLRVLHGKIRRIS